MRKKEIIAVAVFLIIIAVLFIAFFFKIRITGRVITDINNVTECGTLNIPNAVYNLTQDIRDDGTCFYIAANNITIEGNGFSINHSRSTDSTAGIDITGANETTVRNMVIREAGTSWNSGVWIAYSYNTTIKNVTIIVNKDNSVGIIITVGSYYTRILSNKIILNGTSEQKSNAIYLSGSSYGIIANNTLYNLRTSGVDNHVISSPFSTRAQFLSKNNIYSNNDIITNSPNSYGFFLGSSLDILTSNTITTYGTTGYGIYLLYASNNNIFNNTITTSGEAGYGLAWSLSINNLFMDNTIATSGERGHGIVLDSSSSSNLNNINVKTNNTNASSLYIIKQAHNFTIKDSILNSSLSSDIYINDLVTGGEWNFTNVTRANGSAFTRTWVVGANGALNVKWYLDVAVKDMQGILLNNIDVNITSKKTNKSFIRETVNGVVKEELLDYKVVNGIQDNFTDYHVKAAKIGYFSNETNVSLTISKSITLTLKQFDIIPLINCGELTNSDRTYNLTQNVSSSGTCFNITADSIALLGNGFLVNYSTSVTGYGVYVNSSSVSINDLNFADNGNSGAAIYLNNSNDGEVNNIDVNIISDNSSGIYLSGNNTDIRNNKINVYGFNAEGVFSNGQDNSIVDNVINTNNNASDSITLWISNNNKIRRNIISSNNSLGISVYSSSNANIDNNNITTYNSNNIETFSSPNLAIINNNLTTYGATGVGIFLDRSNNARIDYNIIIGNSIDGAGIVIVESSNSTFRNNKIKSVNNVTGLLFLYFSDNDTFIDSSINSAANETFFLTGSGTINFINVTLANNRIYFDSASLSRLNVHWYFDASVRNESLDSLDGAVVELKDSGGNLIFSDTTDGFGNIARKIIMDYSRNKDGATNKNPHTVTAIKSGYAALSQQVTINTNTKSILTMMLPAPPSNDTDDGDGGGKVPGDTEGPKTYRVSESQLIQGISLELKKSDKINMSLLGKYYIIKYDSFSGNTATFTINSEKTSFAAGGEKRFDFNKDGKEDVTIRLDGVKNGAASLYLKKIQVVPPEPEKNETIEECNANNCEGECVRGVCVLEQEKAPQRKALIYVSIGLIALILIIVGIIVYVILKRKNDIKRIKGGISASSIKPLKPIHPAISTLKQPSGTPIKMPPRIIPKSPFPVRRPIQQIGKPVLRPIAKPSSDKEIDETLKKLKEIGNGKKSKDEDKKETEEDKSDKKEEF